MNLEKIDILSLKIEKLQIICSWVVTLIITFMITLDVMMRFLFNAPLPASWEISEVAMPYIVMFGFAFTLSTGSHVRVTILVDRLPPKVSLALRTFANILSISICFKIYHAAFIL